MEEQHETLVRRGYRFIAPVNASSPSNSIEIAPLPERSKSLFFVHPIATACIALIIITFWSGQWGNFRLGTPTLSNAS